MKENVGRTMIIALCIVQAVGLISLQNNEFRKQNYAHSTCFGSYLVMTDAELEAVGFPLAERESIGLDYWKNRIKGPGEERIFTDESANSYKKDLSLVDVLLPYLKTPELFVRLITHISPKHFSVQYYHLDINTKYLVATAPDGMAKSKLLVSISRLRDHLLPPERLLLLVAVGLLLPLFAKHILPELALIGFFCAAFAVSQLLVCILGEGIRDLGHHLSAAQYAIDFLLVDLILCISFTKRWAILLQNKLKSFTRIHETKA